MSGSKTKARINKNLAEKTAPGSTRRFTKDEKDYDPNPPRPSRFQDNKDGSTFTKTTS